jgi:hypothetical protein
MPSVSRAILRQGKSSSSNVATTEEHWETGRMCINAQKTKTIKKNVFGPEIKGSRSGYEIDGKRI